MNFSKKLTIVSILLLIIFFFFSRSVRSGTWTGRDIVFTTKLQTAIDKSTHLRTADLVGNMMEGSTFFASPGFSITVIIIITVITFITSKKNRFLVLLIPVLFGLLTLAEVYGKTVVHHPSPPFAMIKHPTSIFPADYINEQFSYPSGHAARAVFISILLIFLTMKQESNVTTRKRTGILVGSICLIYVVLVSISRIYLGHHWISDVIGGLIIGTGLGLLTYIINPRIIGT